MKVECDVCQKLFKATYIAQHKSRQHPECKKETSAIKCCLCAKTFKFREEFRKHVDQEHAKINSSSFTFDNFKDFSIWLNNEENTTKVHFVKRRTPTLLSTGKSKQDYFCQYDNGKKFEIIPQERRKRAPKPLGSYKIEGCCSAQIIVENNVDGSLHVQYFSTHIGHHSSMAHFYLRADERKESADTNAAHRKGCSIFDEDVDVRNDAKPSYYVKSQSDPEVKYLVVKMNETCPYKCNNICVQCNACFHSYECTCIEYSGKGNICKHIHKVCTMLKENPLPASSSENFNEIISINDDETLDHFEDFLHPEVPEIETEKLKNQKEEIKEKLHCLCDEIHKKPHEPSKLELVNKLLSIAISSLIESKKRKRSKTPSPKSLTVSPANKKIKSSQKSYSTKRKGLNIEEIVLEKPTLELRDKKEEPLLSKSLCNHLY